MYKVDTKYFQTIDSQDKAYWLGFILADGYLYKDKYLRIELAEKDKEHLYKFRECLNSNIPIKKSVRKSNYIKGEVINNTPSYVFTVSRKDIVKDLIKLGITNIDKTKKDIVPAVPLEFKRDFVRGYFDGDGCVSNKKRPEAYLLGHKKLLNYAVSDLDINKKLYKEYHSELSLFKLRWWNKQDLEKLFDYLYQGNNITFLSRKKEIFSSIVL